MLFRASYSNNPLVLAAIEAGASGYLLKENDTQQIVDAIHFIMKGRTVFQRAKAG